MGRAGMEGGGVCLEDACRTGKEERAGVGGGHEEASHDMMRPQTSMDKHQELRLAADLRADKLYNCWARAQDVQRRPPRRPHLPVDAVRPPRNRTRRKGPLGRPHRSSCT